MEKLKNVCEFEKYLLDNKPYTDVFLADTLGFIVSTNNKPFMHKFMCWISQSDREKVMAFLRSEGNEYIDWIVEFQGEKPKETGIDIGGGSIDQDVFNNDNDIEALVDEALGGDDDMGTTSCKTSCDIEETAVKYDSDYDDFNFEVGDGESSIGDDFIKEIENSLNIDSM